LLPVVVTLGVALISAGPAAASPTFSITTTPALYPAFNPGVSDYVARCNGSPLSVSVTVPVGMEASVDGQLGHMSSFSTSVNVTTGQGFDVTEIGLANMSLNTYYIRCLPTDFANFTSQVPGTPQAAFYVVKPSSLALFGPNPPQQYLAIFDNQGVPVWWLPDKSGYDAGILRNGNVTSIVFGPNSHPQMEVHNLAGQLVAGLDAVNTGSSTSFDAVDGHDVQLLPNGDYLFAEIKTIQGDLTSIGGTSNATISDQVLEEVTPTGQLVWHWDVAQHIGVDQTDPQWYATALAPGGILAPGADIYHWNSLQEIGNQVLISLRHADAVYDIDKKTGNIIWKIGGSHIPQSLTIVGDPVFSGGGGFGGQHFARFYGGTTTQVTIHDNGTGRGRGPRAVRYVISLAHHTATMVESVSDPADTFSACCGAATKLPGGDWVASWGFSPFVEELNPAGQRQFLLQWTDPGTFSYRVEPVLPGMLTLPQLRTAMNIQYPR
jgi:hypothetical protein